MAMHLMGSWPDRLFDWRNHVVLSRCGDAQHRRFYVYALQRQAIGQMVALPHSSHSFGPWPGLRLLW